MTAADGAVHAEAVGSGVPGDAARGATDGATCDEAQLTRAAASERLVGDVMVARPKTLPADATVGDARELFSNPKVVMALLVDGAAFTGVLERGDLVTSLADGEPAVGCARRDVATITPDRPMAEAVARLDTTGTSRLVVLGPDGTSLAGLLCLDRERSGFCSG